jgi:hypothetical protein
MNINDATNSIKFFELAAAVIGFLNYSKIKNTHWNYLPVFLLLLFSLECLGQYFASVKNYQANINLYKLIVIPSIFSFYSFMFYRTLQKKRILLFIIGMVLFAISLVLENTVLKSLHPYYASLSLGVANLFFLIYCLLYYIELINSDQLITFYNSLGFWFCTGLLVFYLGCLPYFSLYNILVTKFFKTIFLPYTWVFIGLNYLMYSLFSIGFIWKKKK